MMADPDADRDMRRWRRRSGRAAQELPVLERAVEGDAAAPRLGRREERHPGIRAGTGGEEEALFAADLFRMYQRLRPPSMLEFEVMEISETGLGGTARRSPVTGRSVSRG